MVLAVPTRTKITFTTLVQHEGIVKVNDLRVEMDNVLEGANPVVVYCDLRGAVLDAQLNNPALLEEDIVHLLIELRSQVVGENGSRGFGVGDGNNLGNSLHYFLK